MYIVCLAGRWRESQPRVRVDVRLPAVSPSLKAWVTNVQLFFGWRDEWNS